MSDNVYAEGNVLEYQDFFSPFVSYETFTLPDGIQTITFRIMSEGERMRYQQKTNRPISIDRKNDTASIRPDIAQDRHELIKSSVTDWTLMHKDGSGEWRPVVFNSTMLHNWLLTANPKIVSDLELAIRKANPWMQEDMSLEDIDKEIAELQELRDKKVRDDLEKNS